MLSSPASASGWMKTTDRAALAAGILLALSLAGCGPSKPATYLVAGSVSFDGKPVKGGEIVFVPQVRTLGPDAGRIADGKYSAWVKGGKCRVEIRASAIGPKSPRVIGPKPSMGAGAPIPTNYISACYNDQSELTVEVSARARNVFDFQLQSDKAVSPQSR